MLTLVVFVYSDSSNILTPQIAFVSVTLFEIMRIPMSILPLLIVYIVEVVDKHFYYDHMRIVIKVTVHLNGQKTLI